VARKRVSKYAEAFRRMALERLRNCASVSALAEELGVHRTVLYHWQRRAGTQGTDSTATSPVRELRKQVRNLKRVLAEKMLEVDFFKGALQKIETRRESSDGSGETASTTKSGK
jgi:transposase-like protein